MTNVTDQILTEAIESLPEVFDTHAVIRQIMTRHPRQYADDCAPRRRERKANMAN
jgi:hypothetical protein